MVRLRNWTGINPKAGMTEPWSIEVPDGMVLLVDTAEQQPFFMTHGSGINAHLRGDLIMARSNLFWGDYSIKGWEKEIIIERKSAEDAWGSLLWNNEDDSEFKKFQALSKFFRKWLVIESSEQDLLRYPTFGKRTPNQFYGRLRSIEIRLGIPVYYGETRLACERFVLSRLVKYFNLKRSGEI